MLIIIIQSVSRNAEVTLLTPLALPGAPMILMPLSRFQKQGLDV